MTEPRPTYTEQPPTEPHPLIIKRVTPTEAADMLTVYLTRRRDVLISELRELDRLLGRDQTIPERLR